MKKFLKKCSFLVFKILSRVGILVLPNHYYSSIADVNELEKTKENWAKKSEMPGIQTDLDGQVSNLQKICGPFLEEYRGNDTYLTAVNEHFGPGYGFLEAQALHGFIRFYQPKNIIEIGSGVSTFCMLKAIETNKKEKKTESQITCIEPFPSQKITTLSKIKLLKEKVQSVPFSKFEALSSGDFLFIDSSHTVKPGSDVNYLILEVLPTLSKGVFVHFHDIYFPFDYQRDVLKTYFQWMETSLLRAFLINNHKVRVIFCLSQLHYDRPAELKKVFPDYRPANDKNGLEFESNIDPNKTHFPASIYLEIL
ncbi:MAG: hypothetical protein GVY20_07090 [Bacteroidetes bacterium]|jgi:predicted O-methyltransferase YrrM|nr:hypothetical protein [Bacteroidota bacterium]